MSLQDKTARYTPTATTTGSSQQLLTTALVSAPTQQTPELHPTQHPRLEAIKKAK